MRKTYLKGFERLWVAKEIIRDLILIALVNMDEGLGFCYSSSSIHLWYNVDIVDIVRLCYEIMIIEFLI